MYENESFGTLRGNYAFGEKLKSSYLVFLIEYDKEQ